MRLLALLLILGRVWPRFPRALATPALERLGWQPAEGEDDRGVAVVDPGERRVPIWAAQAISSACVLVPMPRVGVLTIRRKLTSSAGLWITRR